MTTTLHSPTAGRRRLRSTLHHAREAAGLTQKQVAEEMDWSPSKVIRIETGGVGISTSDLRQLLQLYRIEDPEQVSELVALAKISRERRWWTRFKESVPGPYLSYVGLEDESSALRCVSPTGLPGLLQTEEFAHAIIEASLWTTVGPSFPSTPASPVVAERVDMRMIRQQEVLGRDNPPDIAAVLDEAVLWRRIGGAGVLQRQLRHLVALGEEPHITVQVLPFAAGMVNMVSSFVILEFPDPHDTDAVFVEGAAEATILDGAPEVKAYREVFDRLWAGSLPEPESLQLITRVADTLDP